LTSTSKQSHSKLKKMP